MPTGKVVRFDAVRGYGFVAPTEGGEDVFLHVNDLVIEKSLIQPGVMVEFDVENGDRGLKAADVRLAHGAARAEFSSRPSPRSGVDDGLSDVLSAKEFREEITESLLGAVPDITGAQIVRIREHLMNLAVGHGWVDA
jgi:cold shock protein